MKSSDFVDLAAPDRACGCAAKLSLRSEHELPHESRSGAATKKEPQKRFLLVASVKKIILLLFVLTQTIHRCP